MEIDIVKAFKTQKIDEIKKYVDDGNDIKSLPQIKQLVEQQAYFGGIGLNIIKLMREYVGLDISSYSLLKNACFSTDYNLVKYLFDNNLDLKSINSIGESCFAATVTTPEREINKIKILNLLLDNNADPNQFIETAVLLNKEATKILIKKNVSLIQKNRNGMQLLELIGRRKLSHPLTYSLLPDNSNEIHVTIAENNMPRFLELVPSDMAKEIPTMKPPVYTAVEYGRLDMLKVLINNNTVLSPVSSVFGKDNKDENLLHLACKQNNLEILSYLLSLNNLSVNTVNTTYWGEETCLNIAVSNGNVKMVDLLLKNNANPNTLFNKYTVGITVGALAMNKQFNKDVLILLIKGGLNLNVNTRFGTVKDYLISRGGVDPELLK